MKTHSYLSLERHNEICPKINIGKGSTMACEDCLIGGLVTSPTMKGAYNYECDTDKFEQN